MLDSALLAELVGRLHLGNEGELALDVDELAQVVAADFVEQVLERHVLDRALAQPLDRLAAYLNEEKGLPIKRSRISEILIAEGLRWREEETWFGERPDPAFAAQRGRSSRSTRRRLRVVS